MTMLRFLNLHRVTGTGVKSVTIKSKSKKNVTIALQEIAAGKVRLAEDGKKESESDE